MEGNPKSSQRLFWAQNLPALAILAWWIGDLQYHWRELDEYRFGWLVLLLAAYLAMERWRDRPQTSARPRFSACLALAIAGAPFVLLAELYKQAIGNSPAASFCLSIGCILFLVSQFALVHGWPLTRHFLFPLFFFCFAVPLPGIVWSPITMGLKTVITALNVQTLNLVGIPAVQQANIIQLPNAIVGIDEACSGIRSLQSSLMIGLFIGQITLKHAKSKWAFVAGAAVFALAGNFARSWFLSVTAYLRGSEALRQFHDAAGWSIFLFTSAGLVLLAALLKSTERTQQGGRL